MVRMSASRDVIFWTSGRPTLLLEFGDGLKDYSISRGSLGYIYIHLVSMGAAENDRKHDDLCVRSMGLSLILRGCLDAWISGSLDHWITEIAETLLVR